jgi:FtsH-binding integral membrane protein
MSWSPGRVDALRACPLERRTSVPQAAATCTKVQVSESSLRAMVILELGSSWGCPANGREEFASMADFNRSHAATPRVATDRAAIDAGLRAYMIRVYNTMAIGVALTGVVAWLTSQIVGPALLNSPLIWVFILAPLALVFFISFRIDSLSAGTALTLFFVYAASLGLSLATIFFVYTETSITRVFFIAAAAFGALSVWGYTTQRNLTGVGSFLLMGLIGVVIASLVNIFLKSSGLDWIISLVGVIVFAGLTAWDTQKIKEMYDPMDDGTVAGRKAVMGALSLYLDFINLFMLLLRLLGNRR